MSFHEIYGSPSKRKISKVLDVSVSAEQPFRHGISCHLMCVLRKIDKLSPGNWKSGGMAKLKLSVKKMSEAGSNFVL